MQDRVRAADNPPTCTVLASAGVGVSVSVRERVWTSTRASGPGHPGTRGCAGRKAPEEERPRLLQSSGQMAQPHGQNTPATWAALNVDTQDRVRITHVVETSVDPELCVDQSRPTLP